MLFDTLAVGGQKLFDTGIVPCEGGEGFESTEMDFLRMTSPERMLQSRRPGYGRNTPGVICLRVPTHRDILSPMALL